MLSAYLDEADAAGRDRLTRSDKASLAFHGLGARLDEVVPAVVRSGVAVVMVGLLGAYGLFTGIVFEWAPWASLGRSHWLTQIAPEDGSGLPTFGPFLSPYAIVAILAVAAWLSSFTAPGWLYRMFLLATVVAGTVTAALAHAGAAGVWMRATPSLFAACLAFLALVGGRPRFAGTAVGTAAWMGIFCASSVLLGPWTAAHFLEGTAPVSDFFEGVVPPALVYFGVLLLLTTALLAFAAGRRRFAGVVTLCTVPWGLVACAHGWSGRDPAFPLALIAAFGLALAVAVLHRRTSLRSSRAATA